MMLVDALREDFVEFDSQATAYRHISPTHPDYFRGKQLSLFKELREKYPQNSVLLPMESA